MRSVRPRHHIAIRTPSVNIYALNQRVCMKDLDVHKIEQRLESSLRRLNESNISERNKELILEFRDYAFSIGLSKSRILKYMNLLQKLSEWLNMPFDKANKNDIMRVMRHIEQKNYASWTKNDFKVILKRFYKWLNGDDEYPEAVKWIKCTMKKNNQKLPEDLISQREVESIIKAADRYRDKALVSLLYETGCRISEILNMRIKHVSFDDYGAKITVHGKTGMRRLRVVSSVPYLSAWIEIHPSRDDKESPLWVGLGTRNKGKPIRYSNVRVLIAKLAKKAGIKKRVNPHLFRHSRATHLAKHLTEAQMNQYFGWVQGSDMPATYVHMSGRDVDYAILKLHGIKDERKEEKEEITLKKCRRCGKMNPSAGKLCIRCGAPLDVEAAMRLEEKRKEMDDLMAALLRDPEVRSLVRRKMMEMRMKFRL